MPHDEVHRNLVVAGARNNQISIPNSRIDKLFVGVLDELVVLKENSVDSSTPLPDVSEYSAAEANVIFDKKKVIPSQWMKILYFMRFRIRSS